MGSVLFPDFYLYFITGFLGAAMASFLGVYYERREIGKSLYAPSACICGRRLKWHQNVPVFGWLISKGKAKCCGARIPGRYFVTELVGALAMMVFVGDYLIWPVEFYVTSGASVAGWGYVAAFAVIRVALVIWMLAVVTRILTDDSIHDSSGGAQEVDPLSWEE